MTATSIAIGRSPVCIFLSSSLFPYHGQILLSISPCECKEIITIMIPIMFKEPFATLGQFDASLDYTAPDLLMEEEEVKHSIIPN